MHPSHQRVKYLEGFTLLEIVVAVAIFGVIASIVFPSLMQFLEMRDRVEEKQKHLIGLQKSFIFLANDLRYAVTRTSKDEFGEPLKTTLTLNDDALLDFVTVYPDLNLESLGVPRRVVWKLEDEALVRMQYPVMDPDSDTRVIHQLLLDDVQSVDIEVSSIQDGRSEEDDNWEEVSRLPDMITVVITSNDKREYMRQITMQPGTLQLAQGASQQQGASGQQGSQAQQQDNN